MGQSVTPEQVRKQLALVLSSNGFSGAAKLQGFLRYVVEQTLAGRTDEIKESLIGLEVYHKPANYDPRFDSTVRVEASKLRSRLDHFYETEGVNEPVRISIPKGTYIPQFELRSPAAQPKPAPPLPPLPEPGIPPSQRYSGVRTALASILAIAAGLGIGWALFHRRDGGAAPPGRSGAVGSIVRLTQLTETGAFAVEPEISPDGTTLFYSSDRDSAGVPGLWRQPLDGVGAGVRLTAAGVTARMPSISANGKELVFRLEEFGGMLGLVGANGGPVERVAIARRARHPRFSPGSREVAYWVPQDEQTLDHGSVFVLNLDERNAAPSRLFGEFAHAAQPLWSSDGTHVLAVGTWQSGIPAREYDAWTVAYRRGEQVGAPVKTGLFPVLEGLGFHRNVAERAMIEITSWRDGWIQFSAPNGDGSDLYRARLEPGRPFGGSLERVSGGAGRSVGARAAKGRLVFSNSLVSYDLYSAPLSASAGSGETLTRLSALPGVNIRASVDPGGRRAAWEIRRGAGFQRLWFVDLPSRAGRALGGGLAAQQSHVLVAPDGERAAFMVLEGNRNQAIYLETFAPGTPKRICEDCGIPTDWTANGSHLLYATGGQPSGIGLLDLASGRRTDLLNHPSYGLYGARYRVDGAGNGWMVLYADNGPRTRQVFVAPVKAYQPAAYQQWTPLTDGAHWDLSPAWGPDGRTVYFVSGRDGHRCIWKREFDPQRQLPAGDPQPVHHFHSPERSLMRSVSNRGADALWVAGGRLFFSLDSFTSSLWMLE